MTGGRQVSQRSLEGSCRSLCAFHVLLFTFHPCEPIAALLPILSALEKELAALCLVHGYVRLPTTISDVQPSLQNSAKFPDVPSVFVPSSYLNANADRWTNACSQRGPINLIISLIHRTSRTNNKTTCCLQDTQTKNNPILSAKYEQLVHTQDTCQIINRNPDVLALQGCL